MSFLMKTAYVLALAASMQTDNLSMNPAPGPVESSRQFPTLTSRDLAGHTIALPDGLPGDRTVLLIAFAREQQKDIDGWVAGLHLDDGKIPWLEVPVIDNPGPLVRWFIDSGMRRGIQNHETWKHVVTLYIRKSEFKAAIGVTDESKVYAMVVDRHGKILVTVPGLYTPQGAATIQAAASG